MVKNYLLTTLIGLGITQALIGDEASQESCCPPIVISEPLDPACIGAVYPYPANFSPCCGWDIYAKGDFLYLSSENDDQINSAAHLSFDNSDLRWCLLNTDYRPGFRISIGVDLDSAVLDVSYLRHHAHRTSHFNAKTGGGVVFSFASPSFLSLIDGQPQAFFQNVKIAAQLNIDTLLVSLQRPVYMGKRILMNLNYGLLTFWAENKYRFTGVGFTAPLPALPPTATTANGVYKAHHKSWAVGPNLGFTATALLPWHFQIIGAIDLALQYAEYYKVFSNAAFPDYRGFDTNPAPLGTFVMKKRHNIPHLQAAHTGELGIGWGDYFGCDNRYHVNVSVTYNWIFQHIYGFGDAFGLPLGWDASGLTSIDAHGIAIGGRLDF